MHSNGDEQAARDYFTYSADLAGARRRDGHVRHAPAGLKDEYASWYGLNVEDFRNVDQL